MFKLPLFTDTDYEGGITLCLHNTGGVSVELKEGQSYAQLIPVRYYYGPVLGASDYCFRTARGGDGFGSTEERLRLEKFLSERLKVVAPSVSDGDDEQEEVVRSDIILD